MRDLALFHAALSDETRLRLLSLMKHREICVCYLQEVLKTNQPRISRHLAYLRRAGLVKVRREGTYLWYSANSGALQELLGFLYAECCTRNKAIEPQAIVRLCR